MALALSHIAHPDMIALYDTGLWAPPEMLQEEAAFARSVRQLHDALTTLDFPQDWLAAQKTHFITQSKTRIDSSELDDQLDVLFEAFGRAALLSVITGPPGAAKSTIASLWLRIARARYPDMPVVLLTQEEPALHRLNDKFSLSGSHAWTTDRALEQDWPHDAAIVIDEAGLFGTDMLCRLLQKAVASNAQKIILIGDDKQLVSTTPGQPFRWLCEQEKTDRIELQHSFRQKNLWLRQAVSSLYKEDVTDALRFIPMHYLAQDTMVAAMAPMLAEAAEDNTLIIVHGMGEPFVAKLRAAYPLYRVLSLAAAQGLAVDRVVLLVGAPLNLAELLVGCSRQRYDLDLLIDRTVYHDAADFAARIAPYPKSRMVLDILSPQQILDIVDQTQVS